MSAPAALSFTRKSGRATLPRWPASPARTSVAFSTIGSVASWSADFPVIIALRTPQSCKLKLNCNAAAGQLIGAVAINGVARSCCGNQASPPRRRDRHKKAPVLRPGPPSLAPELRHYPAACP